MSESSASARMPVLFVAHGAPTLVMEQTPYTEFLKRLPGSLPRPKAIVIWSAHWISRQQKAGNAETMETIHDFGGFPQRMYEYRYPAPGDPELAQRITDTLAAAGIEASADGRGLDHGAWCPLLLMWPDADIPVVPLSVNPQLAPERQYEIGKLFASLRDEGILVMASGGLVHNLRKIYFEAQWNQAVEWAVRFDEWLERELSVWNLDALFRYESLAPYAAEAVPNGGSEHFVPLLYAMGAADDCRSAKKLVQHYQAGSLSLNVWRFD
jgi:4,5-DOPA dioxygenase extradiol